MNHWLLNLRLRLKLVFGYAIVACIAAMIGIFAIVNFQSIDDRDTELYEENTVPIAVLGSWMELFNSMRVAARDVLLSDDPNYRQQRADRISELHGEMEPMMDRLKATVAAAEESRTLYESLEAAFAAFHSGNQEVVRLALAGENVKAMELQYGKLSEQASLTSDAALGFMSELERQAKLKVEENTVVANRASLVMIALIVIAMLLAVGLGSWISGFVVRPIQTLVEASRKVADGDLNVDIDIRTKDEIGTLAQAFGAMTDSMNEVLHNIANASEQVASGSRQVSEASQELSQGSTEQASSIQQLTASMEQIASQTKQNAANAAQANRLAISASEDAEQGNGQMKEMLAAMEQINESSGNISKIIKVIDEIAFQTNILALNAAVEAARAGQHGKGFAVVAEEVRNLAARSANAAKDTTSLIEGSIKKVEAGTRIANDTAAALEKIVGGVGKAADLVGSIANASNEQASGILQANQGIAQVSEVIQANSATSEECAAASEELSGQSEQLKEMVGKFRLKRNTSSMGFGGYEAYAGHDSNRTRLAPAFARAEVAATSASGKPRIRLDDDDFGKYE
ncbi:methyl-accepting chemotaxis protein [Paenibacillus sp.]|uniref:methyl-accepting chemotaxis protein n=1 Tax=Paenibacillus sp. TaxID=58172 RepID=UPI0028112EA2|nr:methyl-accepting chemotaxis protein [Paenibacillus sp.]